ncbi:HET-domain-containing protein [Dendrothele bispora CBS 962.96]|uniref:HET-domain-containing protein n=1 Tax=Dendrothele bispora (strain CBS 962.96) TaxID=1314807 RepID=A0A4S8LN25_DENBC|nr:HET-domain-containing protein [Dendrothele bispora CBS 962.96]
MQQTPSSELRPQRLIETYSGKLKDFSGQPVPPYAILSHRWLDEKEEVTFHDYLHLLPETKKKAGYRKIVEARRKAAKENLEYIWIDTCCIDRSNKSELDRNINSMYSYYQNSQICYVYLSDVWVKTSLRAGATIWGSEWFKRGWTLQELVAPKQLIFFKADWEPIGGRQQLTSVIHHLTGIPPSVLNGSTPIKSVDIRTRMSWCAGRETTKPPDLAYCLLGILEVSMAMDYTESRGSAFKRLQEVLAHKYPNKFKKFEDPESIYRFLLRQNAEVRVGMGQRHTVPQAGHALPQDALPRVGHALSQDALSRVGHALPQDVLPRVVHALPRAGHAFPRAGYAFPRAGHVLPRAGHALPPTGHALPRAGHALLQVGHAVGNAVSSVGHTGHWQQDAIRTPSSGSIQSCIIYGSRLQRANRLPQFSSKRSQPGPPSMGRKA